MRPKDFDVVLCCNQLGDILSDLTVVYSGSL
ncbi:MAG: isocitrate/isopropylmalate family dehydrogenase [Pikeienuella sp.]